jgi:hypothetical protein
MIFADGYMMGHLFYKVLLSLSVCQQFNTRPVGGMSAIQLSGARKLRKAAEPPC